MHELCGAVLCPRCTTHGPLQSTSPTATHKCHHGPQDVTSSRLVSTAPWSVLVPSPRTDAAGSGGSWERGRTLPAETLKKTKLTVRGKQDMAANTQKQDGADGEHGAGEGAGHAPLFAGPPPTRGCTSDGTTCGARPLPSPSPSLSPSLFLSPRYPMSAHGRCSPGPPWRHEDITRGGSGAAFWCLLERFWSPARRSRSGFTARGYLYP